MVYLFKKTAVVSVDIEPRRVPQGHRRLRFSFQINDFKDPNQQSQPNRLTPGRGGGGDLIGRRSPVKRPFRGNDQRRQGVPPKQGRRVFSASSLRVKSFF